MGPEYQAAVPMPDGSAYLCGNMPRPPGKYQPGIVTHINAQGHVLGKQLLIPEKRTEKGIAYIRDAVRCGDDVAIVGTAHNIIKVADGGQPPVVEEFYWLLVLDASGKKKWEKLIPIIGHFGTSHNGTVLIAVGSSLVFSVNNSINTEVFRVSSAGEVQAHKQFLTSRLMLIRQVIPDGAIMLFGDYQGIGPLKLTINDQLEIITRVEGGKINFVAHAAYCLPDQSLALFGSEVGSHGNRFFSHIVYADKALHVVQRKGLCDSGQLYKDSGSLNAATPAGGNGVFVTARTAFARGLDPRHPEKIGEMPDFKRGAVLDFIQLTQ